MTRYCTVSLTFNFCRRLPELPISARKFHELDHHGKRFSQTCLYTIYLFSKERYKKNTLATVATKEMNFSFFASARIEYIENAKRRFIRGVLLCQNNVEKDAKSIVKLTTKARSFQLNLTVVFTRTRLLSPSTSIACFLWEWIKPLSDHRRALEK